MIVRIWRTQVDSSRLSVYELFEREHSLPMFQKQAGGSSGNQAGKMLDRSLVGPER